MSRETSKGSQDAMRFTPETFPSELVYEYGVIVGAFGNAGSRQELISQLNSEAAADDKMVINVKETILDDGRLMVTGMFVPKAI